MKGAFIVIEGADGTGKSTQVRLLAEYLRVRGLDVVTTQEPTRGHIGQFIRQVLSGEEKVSPNTLALLFTADRSEHVDKVVRPALEAGKAVISDRYYYSTVAYQSAQGVSPKWLSELNSFAPEPDLVIVLEVDYAIANQRLSGRAKEVFEVEDFQRKVQDALLDIARGGHLRLSRPGKSWKVIDASLGIDEVQKRIRDVVDLHLK